MNFPYKFPSMCLAFVLYVWLHGYLGDLLLFLNVICDFIKWILELIVLGWFCLPTGNQDNILNALQPA